MYVSKIKPEEIIILKKLLKLDESLVIYDPLHRLTGNTFCIIRDLKTLLGAGRNYTVCINLSDQPLKALSFNFILEVNSKKRTYTSFFCEQFLTITNPDKSIRWITPASAKHPDFLNLYNGSGFKASVFSFLSRTVFKLGLERWFCHGTLTLYSKEKEYLRNLFNQKDYALFTGTVGPNRKAVAVICQDGKPKQFIKIPITARAKALVRAEHRHLSCINKYPFESLRVPLVHQIKDNLVLSNIQPLRTFVSAGICEKHFRALKDLYGYTLEHKVFRNLDLFNEIPERLARIKRTQTDTLKNIPDKKVERLAYNIKVLFNSLDGNEILPVAYAHGDFTPWNMFESSESIHLYDWELAMPEQLLLYDAFHYVFQSSVLISNLSFDSVQKKIKKMEEHAICKGITDHFGVSFQTSYIWYLVNNCSYYLDLYQLQQHLHPQAYWLIDCWIEATTAAIKTKKAKSTIALI